MVRKRRVLAGFIAMIFAALLMPTPAQAATVTPAPPPCVRYHIFSLECDARNAYSDVAMSSVIYLRTPSGRAPLDRLALGVLGGAAAKNNQIRSSLVYTRELIRIAYIQRDYNTASCIRTALLRTVVTLAKADNETKRLGSAMGYLTGTSWGRIPLSSVYKDLLNRAPNMASTMSRYANAYAGGLAAMGCDPYA
jgi:hypothetical protein